MSRKPDFSGWATKFDVKCRDGRIIKSGAFAEQEGAKVPVVYNHNHDDPEMILGHALLFNKPEGVWADGYLNQGNKANSMREVLKHSDVASLSIYANDLKQRATAAGKEVMHGVIRELSIVLAGANPEAFIEDALLAHGDFFEEAAIVEISPDVLIHSEEGAIEEKEPKMEKEELNNEELEHADGGDDKTVGEVLETLNEDQKKAVAILLDAVAGEDDEDDDDDEEDDADMKHNVFEGRENNDAELMHGLNEILANSKRTKSSSLKEDVIAHAAEYGIDGMDFLMPEYRNINGDGAPEFIKRQPDDWVSIVMNGVHHTPFSRIKMQFADITGDDARAKGYAEKGKLKREEVFGLLRRTVDPTTVYKKQKFDKQDIDDITDFSVIPWVKQEMRMMLDEELARAYLFGDGRSALDPDKIDESHIIPIVSEQPLFRMDYTITQESGETYEHAFIRSALLSLDDYQGSGNTIMFTAQKDVTKLLLMEDGIGHRLYKTTADLALAMSVNRIVKVPSEILPNKVKALIVDLNDYNVGADRGGRIDTFDDFDIDYNQMKYLMETRCSGALTKPFSAIVLKVA